MGSTAASLLVDDRPEPLLVAVLVVVSVADIATTQVALTLGAAELSPIGRHIVSHGPLAMAAAKLVAALAVGVPRWYGRRICLAGLAFMTAVAAGSNALQVTTRVGLF